MDILEIHLEEGRMNVFDRWSTLRGVCLCPPGLHRYAAYLPRCPWCATYPEAQRSLRPRQAGLI